MRYLRWMVALLAAASTACGGARPPPAGPGPDAERPYSLIVRRAIETYYPRILTRGAGETVSYVWLIADGRGRIVGRALSSVPPRSMVQREAILEKFPHVDTEREAVAVPDAAFPTAGTSVHLPGELGPDTVYVFWADHPYSVRRVPTPVGPFLLGRAAAEQISPRRIRQLAANATPDDVVWYVYTDDSPLLDAGVYEGLHPREAHADSVVAAVRRLVRARYSGGALTCSLGTSLPNRTGGLVMTMSVRYEPPKQ